MYEWDETKRQLTLAERGVDFADMAAFDWDTALVLEDDRQDYGEMRYRALGTIRGRPYAAVVTLRGANIRVISLGKANTRERKLWENA